VSSGVARPPQSESVVSVRGLVKRYGSHEAVAGIDLEMRRGEIFAFLGPNGGGKATRVEILEGFRAAHSGTGFCPGARPGHGGRRLAGPGGSGLAGVGARARPVRPGVPGHVHRVLWCAVGTIALISWRQIRASAE
jgi:energy-coupling factor transporter ATP-binding protein EcfA2